MLEQPSPAPADKPRRSRVPRILTAREERILDLQRQVDRLTRRERKLRARQRRTAVVLRKLRARRAYFLELLAAAQQAPEVQP